MDNKKITISAAPRLAGMLLAFAFLLTGQMLFAQSKQVTGVVKDATGETVIGASVLEKVLPIMVLLQTLTVTSN